MTTGGLGQILLLDADPDLTLGLSADEFVPALAASRVQTMSVAPGLSALPGLDHDAALYVLSGAVGRRLVVDARPSLELLGSGQIIRPEYVTAPGSAVVETSWRVLSPTWLAVLDSEFWRRMAQFHRVTLALLDRVGDRSDSLAARLAINRNPNLALRIQAMLWHLAERHGRVTSQGVTVGLRLPHEVIAELVGASRPAVSAALKRLETRGDLTPVEGGYVLHGAEQRAAYSRAAAAADIVEKGKYIVPVRR